MEVKIKLRTITIKDKNTGEEYTVKTVRSAQDIAEYVEESEKDEVIAKLEQAVFEVYAK